MKRLGTFLLLLLALGGNAAVAAPAWAKQGDAPVTKKSRTMSLDQAVAQVREQTGGRVLSAETVREEERLVHRIKVLTQERKVRVITVPAE